MPVVAFTALWLAASAPAAPATESSEPPAPAAADPSEERNKLKARPSSTTVTKKTGAINDEPGCEE